MSSNAEDKLRIWDAYWQDSRLNSAGPDSNPDIETALETHWSQAATALPEGAAVLDLACGNGAVSLAVARLSLQTAKGLRIVAIDSAAIDPPRYVARHADVLKTIDFKPLTRMEALPFEAGTFDAVFSQFGLEYGELTKAGPEAARVLKRGGNIIILALPASSGVVEQATKKVKQTQHVLTQTKLFDVALAVCQALYNVESSGEGRDTRQYLDRFNSEVERAMQRFANTDSDMVVAVVMALQKVFTDRKTTDLAQQLASITNLRKRLSEHVARTEAMSRAALGDAALNGLKRRLQESGLVGVDSKPLSVGTHGTVAWRITAKKP